MAGLVGGAVGIGRAFGSKNRGFSLPRSAQNIRTPGFKFETGTDRSQLERTGTLLGNIDPAQRRLFSDLGGLRSEVRPGFGRFTRSAVAAIRSAADRARGNLRNQLSRRRVLGSNFGAATEATAELEFGKVEEEARSRALLEEIAVSRQLIEQQTGILQAEVERELQEFGVAANVQSNVSALIADIGKANAEIAAQQRAREDAALGDFFGALESEEDDAKQFFSSFFSLGGATG